MVQPNDLVAELDPQPKRDALHEAQAKLAQAEAALHEASNNMERKRTLTSQGWATKADYDAAERTFQTAKAELMSPRRNCMWPRTSSATPSFWRMPRVS